MINQTFYVFSLINQTFSGFLWSVKLFRNFFVQPNFFEISLFIQTFLRFLWQT